MSKRVVMAAISSMGILAAPALAQDSAQVDRGMQVFAEQKCSVCHSVAGKGNPKGRMDDIGLRLSSDEIRAWITTPKQMTEKTKAERKPPMREFPNLAKDDVDALVVYLETLKKK